MKIAVIFATILFTYVATADNECPLVVALENGLKECVELLKPSEETVNNIKDDKGEDDRATNCLRACMLKKGGVMEGSKVNLEKMEEMMKSGKDANKEAIEAVIGGLKECREEAEKSTDECEVAASYSLCFKAMKDAAEQAASE